MLKSIQGKMFSPAFTAKKIDAKKEVAQQPKGQLNVDTVSISKKPAFGVNAGTITKEVTKTDGAEKFIKKMNDLVESVIPNKKNTAKEVDESLQKKKKIISPQACLGKPGGCGVNY